MRLQGREHVRETALKKMMNFFKCDVKAKIITSSITRHRTSEAKNAPFSKSFTAVCGVIKKTLFVVHSVARRSGFIAPKEKKYGNDSRDFRGIVYKGLHCRKFKTYVPVISTMSFCGIPMTE